MKGQFQIAVFTVGTKVPEKITVECKSTNDPNKWVGHCPLGTHEDKHPSFYIYLNTNDKHWHCFGCKESGLLWDEDKAGSKMTIETTYDYTDEQSNLLYQVVRLIPKDFRQRRPDPDNKGKWIWNTKGVRKVLYNLPRILKFPKSIIFILEGEKACDRFNEFTLVATTCVSGAEKWKDEYNVTLKDRDVVAIPDNDDTGRRHCEDIGNRNIGNTKSFKIVTLPDQKEKEGADDWLDKIESLNITKKEIIEQLKGYIDVQPEYKGKEVKEEEGTPITEKECVSLLEVKKANLPEAEMIIDGGLIPKIEGFGMIGGETKEGKTIFALEMSLALISGNDFLEDFSIKKKCVIAYIYHENTLKGMDKITDMQIAGFAEKGTSIEAEDIDNFYCINGKKMVFGLSLEDSILGNLVERLKKIKPDVIFLDPLMQFVGFSLNDAKNIKRFDDLMQAIYPCFWMLIHHYVKPHSLQKGESKVPPIYRLLGSSYLANACETFIGIEREGDDYVEEYKMVYFTVRHERTPYPMHLYRNPDTLRYEVLDSDSIKKGKMSMQDIAKVLEKSFGKTGATHKDLTRLCEREYGIKSTKFDRLLREAKEAGIIFKAEGRKGHWYNRASTL